MNGSSAMSSICLDSDLILRKATENPMEFILLNSIVFLVCNILFQRLVVYRFPNEDTTQYRDFTLLNATYKVVHS